MKWDSWAERERTRYTLSVLSLFAFSSCVIVSACNPARANDGGLEIQRTIAPSPLRVGPSVLTLQIAQRDGSPLHSADISVEADMSHPGMPPSFSHARELAPGRYEAPLNLTMPGDWVLLLHLRLQNGTLVVRQLDLRNVEPK